jgi:hypothetical protein
VTASRSSLSTSLGLISASNLARRSTPSGSRSGTTAADKTTLFGTMMRSARLASVV